MYPLSFVPRRQSPCFPLKSLRRRGETSSRSLALARERSVLGNHLFLFAANQTRTLSTLAQKVLAKLGQ